MCDQDAELAMHAGYRHSCLSVHCVSLCTLYTLPCLVHCTPPFFVLNRVLHSSVSCIQLCAGLKKHSSFNTWPNTPFQTAADQRHACLCRAGASWSTLGSSWLACWPSTARVRDPTAMALQEPHTASHLASLQSLCYGWRITVPGV